MPSRDTVRFMTWNVLWRFEPRWADRQEGIATTLAAHQPGVVGLQESWAQASTSQAEKLAAPLGMHSVFAGPSLPDLPTEPESPDHVGVGLGLSVLSRWPIRHSWTHALPSTRPEAPAALIAVIEHPRGPLPVICVCAEHHAHLAADHLAQTRELARLATGLAARGGELPVVLMGDLNAGPDSPELQALTAEMTDAWKAASGGPGGDGVTLSSAVPFAPRGAVKQLNRRVDYVLFRPSATGRTPEATAAYVAADTVGSLHPSDHYAVVADLAFPGPSITSEDGEF